MMTDDVQGRKYTGFGRCIYCGSGGGETGLRDEHIIPFSLGGNAVIERASCAECEKKTSRIEGYLSRMIFLQFRTHTGVQTRRPKERPKSFDAVIRIGESVIEERPIPVADHPMFLMVPILPIAGLLRNEQPTTQFEGATVTLYYGGHDDMHQRLGVDQSRRLQIKIDTTMDLALFGRALAKISFCTAVATFGLVGFNHLDMPQLILGNYPFVPHYLGGDGTQGTSPPEPDSLHRSDIDMAEVGGSRMLVVKLRLFANHNANGHGLPTYKVIVGALHPTASSQILRT